MKPAVTARVGSSGIWHLSATNSDRQLERRTIALYGENDLLTRLRTDHVDKFEPVVVGNAVNSDHHVACLNPGRCCRALRVAVGALGLDIAGNAGGHRVDSGGQRGDSEHDQRHGVEQRRQEQVHGRTAEHDDELLVHRQLVEGSVLLARPDLLDGRAPGVLDHRLKGSGAGRGENELAFTVSVRRKHPDHPDVATERNGLDAVLGLTANPRPHRRTKADHVLRDPDAEALGRNKVTDLVQGDRTENADGENG